jgi:DNA-directed RNA polymerase subunit RPC12/RpoP
MAFENSCPGAKRFIQPSPEEFCCKKCGTKVEIWSDEMTAECPQCGGKVSRVKEATCLDHCPSAEQCLGVMKYRKLLRDGMITKEEPSSKRSRKSDDH